MVIAIKAKVTHPTCTKKAAQVSAFLNQQANDDQPQEKQREPLHPLFYLPSQPRGPGMEHHANGYRNQGNHRNLQNRS